MRYPIFGVKKTSLINFNYHYLIIEVLRLPGPDRSAHISVKKVTIYAIGQNIHAIEVENEKKKFRNHSFLLLKLIDLRHREYYKEFGVPLNKFVDDKDCTHFQQYLSSQLSFT